MPLAVAISSNADALRKYALASSDLTKLRSVPQRAWATPDATELTHSSRALVRVKDGSMLDAEARRFRNCSASYGHACLKGRLTIYIARRRAVASDSPSGVHHCPVIGGPAISAAMIELQARPSGGARLIQITGRAKREPPA